MNDEATTLLLQVMEHNRAATVLIGSLVEAARGNEVLRTEDVSPCVHAIELSLRHAHDAATGLASLARGNKTPKRGD